MAAHHKDAPLPDSRITTPPGAFSRFCLAVSATKRGIISTKYFKLKFLMICHMCQDKGGLAHTRCLLGPPKGALTICLSSTLVTPPGAFSRSSWSPGRICHQVVPFHQIFQNPRRPRPPWQATAAGLPLWRSSIGVLDL